MKEAAKKGHTKSHAQFLPNLPHNETHTTNFHYYDVIKKMTINMPKYFCLAMTLTHSIGVGNLQLSRNMDMGTIH